MSILRNTEDTYGIIALTLHWIVALSVIGMFPLGLWMVGLDYYDPWRKSAPEIHKAVGVILFAIVIVRILWRGISPPPKPLPSHSVQERRAAKAAHALLYLLLLATMIAGYLITTADGRHIDVFGWFQVPALVSGLPEQADVAGTIHLTLAIALIAIAGIHAFAALKHHFIDRDRTLLRIFGRRSNVNPTGEP